MSEKTILIFEVVIYYRFGDMGCVGNLKGCSAIKPLFGKKLYGCF